MSPRDASVSVVIGTVGFVHGLSHLFMLVLPPAFLFLTKEFDVSIVQLGFIIAGFNLITAVTQYPVGILVDRFGALLCLKIGMALSVISLTICAIAPNIWIFALGYLTCGLANAVYHPADFRLLNTRVPAQRRATAFSVHSLTGNIGFALAPAMVTPLSYMFGWRVGFTAVILLGCAGLMSLWLLNDKPEQVTSHTSAQKVSLSSLATPQLWMQLSIFVLYSVVSGGVQGFSVVAATNTFGYGLELVTAALSVYLLCGSLGILAGGLCLKLISSERLSFAIGTSIGLVATAQVWSGIGGSTGYIIGLVVLGFAMGFVLPARDMLVSRTAQPGLQGQTYGFVTTGINIGQLIAPLLAGYMLSSGSTDGYYAMIVTALLFCLIAGTIRIAPAR